MKRWILLFILIFAIPLVEGLSIMGMDVSMLVLVPSILIFIVLVVFGIFVIKDKLKAPSFGQDLQIELAPPPPPSLSGGISSIEKPAKETLLVNLQKTQKPEIDYVKEIELLEKKIPSLELEKANDELTALIKRFFSDYAGINHEFTFEELEKELKSKNKKVICFANSFSTVNYSPEGISKDELMELMREFRDIVHSAASEAPLTPKFRKEIEEKKKEIYLLLKKGSKLAGSDIKKAMEIYREIFGLYESLIDSEKEGIRPQIIDFYNQLNH